MTRKEIAEHKSKIDKLSQYEMAKLWRFARIGHPYFDGRNRDLTDYFAKRFKELGGMTPELSKQIGWDEC